LVHVAIPKSVTIALERENAGARSVPGFPGDSLMEEGEVWSEEWVVKSGGFDE
jgi:hypothetical protein